MEVPIKIYEVSFSGVTIGGNWMTYAIISAYSEYEAIEFVKTNSKVELQNIKCFEIDISKPSLITFGY